ncbi:hypothetical protein KI387_037380, partial [Taxus chinensis]
PKEIKGPLSRHVCRAILTSGAIVSFVVVVVISLLNQPPKRSHRLWITPHDYHNAQHFLDKMALPLNSAEWNCPCEKVNTISKNETDVHIVDFYLLRERGEALHLKTIQHFCTILNDSSYFRGFYNLCGHILEEGFQWSGWSSTNSTHTLYMNSMRTNKLNPVAFMYDVCMYWAGGISQASFSFLVSHFRMSEKEVSQLKKFGKGIETALRTCAVHTSWPPPTESLYAVNVKAVNGDLLKMQLGIAIKFNWTEYMAVCAPSYCERLNMSSTKWNLFTALAQVGGFISVAIFVLRACVWPVIWFAAGWPTSLRTGSVCLWMDELSATPASYSSHCGMKRSKTVTF